MAITREDSESSLHSWTLLDNEEQSQAAAAVGSTSIDGSCKSSRSSSISGQWITAQELEETSGQQVDGSIQNSSVIVGDDIVDSDGDIVAIEEDTDDHLEEWIRAEAQQRRSLSHQDKVTADWSGLDSPEDDEYSLAESADSSQSESLLAHSLLRQSIGLTGLADGEDGPEEEEALAEELPADYPRGYTRSDKSYVHRRNEEINRGLTMYVVAMAVLVALLAVGHFGGTLIVTRHAHYGAPIDPRHNVLSAGKKHVFSHSALPLVQNDYTEIWNSLQQMLKSQADMKRRIVVLEEENRQLRWRLADSRKRLTRIVHKEAAPSADNKNGSARLDEQQPWWSGASEADSPWTLSDLLYLQQQQQQQQPDRSHVKKPSTITLPSVKQTGLASILRNKSTTLSSSHSTKSNACVDQPSRQTTAPGSSVLHRLMKEKSAAVSTLAQSLRRPAQRVTTTEPTEATGQDEDMAGWNSMKEQVQTMKADILRNFQQVKERYQQVNRSHHGWRNLSLHSTAPHVTPLPSQPAAAATPASTKSNEAKRQDSKYDHCGLGGTLYNDYCQMNLKADPYRHKAAQERPLSQGGPTGRHFWHTVQQLSRTKKMEKVLRKIWSLDVLGSPRLKDVMARVPHTFKTSRDWVSCQWRWWQRALDRTHPSSYGQCSPYLTAWWHNHISVQDIQRRGRCPGKDGQCKVELQKGDKVKSKVQSLRQEEKKHKTRPAKIEKVVDHLLESRQADWYLQRAVDRATYRLKGLAQCRGPFNMSLWLFQRAQGRQAQRAQHQASHYNNGDTPVGRREEEALPADPIYAFLKHRATLRQQHRYP